MEAGVCDKVTKNIDCAVLATIENKRHELFHTRHIDTNSEILQLI